MGLKNKARGFQDIKDNDRCRSFGQGNVDMLGTMLERNYSGEEQNFLH
jgi:hypothetical protein